MSGVRTGGGFSSRLTAQRPAKVPPPPSTPICSHVQAAPERKPLGAPARRDGLFARPGTSDQLQVSVDPGHDFDLDQEIDGLRGQLGKLKDVREACL